MADSKPNTSSVRVFSGMLDEMKDEQYALRKAGLPEPSYTEMLAALWRSRKAFTAQGEPAQPQQQSNVLSDTLAGLSEEDQRSISDIAQMFRDGSAIGDVIRAGVQAWRESKGIQSEEKKSRRRA